MLSHEPVICQETSHFFPAVQKDSPSDGSPPKKPPQFLSYFHAYFPRLQDFLFSFSPAKFQPAALQKTR
jgi:hypothetical protein